VKEFFVICKIDKSGDVKNRIKYLTFYNSNHKSRHGLKNWVFECFLDQAILFSKLKHEKVKQLVELIQNMFGNDNVVVYTREVRCVGKLFLGNDGGKIFDVVNERNLIYDEDAEKIEFAWFL